MAKDLTVSVDAEGIAAIVLDAVGRSMNVIDAALVRELSTAVEEVITESSVKGVLVTSAKESFLPGYDLAEILALIECCKSPAYGHSNRPALSALYRRIETCGKPFVAAINGLALGGGLELALACHYRVLADHPGALLGLPEVKVGLLPGAGGTQRLPRLIGFAKALPLLLEGRNLLPAESLKLGIIHELAPREDVLGRARRWLLERPLPHQPWDLKGFRIPGGASLVDPRFAQQMTMTTAAIVKSAKRNLPAPLAVLSAAYEGAQVPIDKGLNIESKYFSRLLSSPVAGNLIRTMFINKGKADRPGRRPAAPECRIVSRVGVLGAGMMGQGIAHASALAGMQVVLLDVTMKQAQIGMRHSAALLQKDIEQGRIARSRADEVLNRIMPTTDYAQLAACELVIEAVFEDRAIKAEVTRKAEVSMCRSAILASNTSTLPISELAQAFGRPEQFIGLHFFSPVHKMPLVEIIRGKQTNEKTLAHVLDFIAQMRKTPIVVNDSRGFYTTRCFSAYTAEGQRLLEEGVSPALIENAGRQAGMPVGPLAIADEVSLELQYNVIRQSRNDLGGKFREPINWPVLRHFVEDLRRFGRKSGEGFYDYPQDGPKQLWPGLSATYPRAATQPPVDEVKKRLLYVQVVEAMRCLEEGVVTTTAEADLGSILGWGFPAWTGGVCSFIETTGRETFESECRRLARAYGERYAPSRARARPSSRKTRVQAAQGDAA